MILFLDMQLHILSYLYSYFHPLWGGPNSFAAHRGRKEERERERRRQMRAMTSELFSTMPRHAARSCSLPAFHVIAMKTTL